VLRIRSEGDTDLFPMTSKFTSLLRETLSYFHPHTLILTAQISPPQIIPWILGSMKLHFLESLSLDLFAERTLSEISTFFWDKDFETPKLRKIRLSGTIITPLIEFLTKLRKCQRTSEFLSIRVQVISGTDSELGNKAPRKIMASHIGIFTEGIALSFISLHTLNLTLERFNQPKLSPTTKCLSQLVPNVRNFNYTLDVRLSKDNETPAFSYYCAGLDIQSDGSPPFPLITRLDGEVTVGSERHDEKLLREMILGVLIRRSEAGAIPLELVHFSISSGKKLPGRTTIQFEAVGTPLLSSRPRW
jgi:hypothetical protein